MEFTKKSDHSKISEFLSSRFFYLMTVGVLLAWVMVSGIVDTTVFARNHTTNLIRIFFIVGSFGLLLSHKITRRISLGLFLIGALVIASNFVFTFEEPIFGSYFADLITRTIDFILGNRPYQQIYETFTVWTISLFFSFFVAFFTYHKFQFWILFPVSITTTSIAITSPHFRHAPIFYIYAFCLLALTIRYLQEKKLERISTPSKSFIVTHLIIPFVATVLLVAYLIPAPSTGFTESLVRRPFDFLNEWFWELTHQSEFSLRQIGFGDSGGRLGGDLALNDNVFMEIITSADMPLYLTGATRDTYTGYSWENLHDEFHFVDFDDVEQQLEWAEHALFWDIQWIQSQMEVISAGRLEQIEDIEAFFYERYGIAAGSEDWITGDHRIFFDEVTGHEIWALATTDQAMEWHINISNMINFEQHYSLTIDNLTRRLTSMFHSGIVRNINNDDELSILRNRDGAFSSAERLRANTEYRIQFHRPEYMIEFWIEADEVIEQNLLLSSYNRMISDASQTFQIFRDNYGYELQQSWFALNENIMSFEELLNYHLIPRTERINEIYTTLPDDLPERVRELALEVTSEGENNYERMRLLESFLSSNFYYTLTPGMTPMNQDFVDHFLFDLQQGYCVHFATAFVVMARSLGMPVRYVEGFLVNAEEPGGTIEVLNRMAHAWPEVYFEGFGWVIFEPTPASGIGLQQDDESNILGGNHGSQDQEREVLIVPPQDPRPVEPTDDDFPIGDGGAQTSSEDTQAIPWWVFGGSGVLIAITLFIFVRVTHIRLKRELMMKKDSRLRVIALFNLLLSYLKLFGHEMREIETVSQFAARIGDRRTLGALTSERNLLKQSVSIFIKARYSNQAISEEDCFPVEEIVRNMEHRAELKLGKTKYLFYCYILGKFS